MEKELEDAGIKISSVASDILGVCGRAMLAALIAGQDDAQVMAAMARGRLRTKIPNLVEALTGNFGEHHSFLCRLHLTRIDDLSATIEELSARIVAEMRPFAHQIEHLVTHPRGQEEDRRGHHRRDRWGPDPVPDPGPPRLVGRGLPRPSRVRRHPPFG